MKQGGTFAPLDLARLVSNALIWGVNNVMSKPALNALPPLFTVCVRFLIVLGAVIWLAAALPAGKVRAMLVLPVGLRGVRRDRVGHCRQRLHVPPGADLRSLTHHALPAWRRR